MLAEIDNNEWKVAPPPKSWDRNYSTNALEIKDSEGAILFQVTLEKDFAHFQGFFFDVEGDWAAFTEEAGRASMTLTPRGIAGRIPQIKPLFRYPSDLHLGERVYE